MERRKFIRNVGAATAIAATTGLAGCSSSGLKAGEVLHTVIFDLIHPVGSTDAGRFLKDAQKILTKIKGVHDFQVFRQNSPKNDYQYGFYMRFKSQGRFRQIQHGSRTQQIRTGTLGKRSLPLPGIRFCDLFLKKQRILFYRRLIAGADLNLCLIRHSISPEDFNVTNRGCNPLFPCSA